jgi:adenine-specific DNA-methyltransferase
MARTPKSVEAIIHDGDTRTNIPTAEYENLMRDEDKSPIQLKYPRNSDLDPQLVWRGKDDQDWSDLVVTAPPLYIQEKINPKHIVDDLMRQSKRRADDKTQEEAPDLFVDMFDGDLDSEAKAEFYAHDQNWTNRMILGDSLQVMASLAEREGLRGKVQCIYFDPPYGIKFGSNWQVSTQERQVKDGKVDQVSREPEMVKAFRDTWSDGIHSYLTYLRDRLTIARDLLHESGSIFVQIGDENVHRVRVLLDEIFGEKNLISQITVQKTGSQASHTIGNVADFILWYAKNDENLKNRPLYLDKKKNDQGFTADPLTSDGASDAGTVNFEFQGQTFFPGNKAHWKTHQRGMHTLAKADRIIKQRTQIRLRKYFDDSPGKSLTNIWNDTGGATNVIYVVQSSEKLVKRCICMASDPGDIILDPTCGSGTTAVVAEQMGRRWITIDTSRVALALAKMRIASSKFDFYFLKDSEDGQKKEIDLTKRLLAETSFRNNIRLGFVYKRQSRVTLGAIANNTEIDIIWDNYRETLEPLRHQLNSALNEAWEEWEIPRETDDNWPEAAKNAHGNWWKARISRQKEIDDSIARNSEMQYLFDQPYADSSKVRVAGPFTVESLSPHKVIAVDDDGKLLDNTDAVDGLRAAPDSSEDEIDFGNVILEHLRTAGVQQAHKEDRIKFASINPFPGKFISGDGRYVGSDSDNAPQKRAAIFIGPEYGTLGRPDIVAAAKEARELDFDVLVCCAFNYDAHSSEIDRLVDLPILKARMNPDLHMADELKNTGSGNLFVVFGEPDIEFIDTKDGQMQVKVNGVDVFHPSKGEVISGGPESIAAWFVDTDYNEESFFVRHAYFLGVNDPYKQLKSALKVEIDKEAWESLYRDISRPFPKPDTGRIAVKVINHLGDEVMKVFNVD